MIDALIKRVSLTYKCYEMYAYRGKRCNCSCFEIDQEMDAILLIIGIVYGVCRIVIKSIQQCTYFLFSVKSVNWSKPGYASITCSTISNIPYNLIFTTKFNDSLILITIISCDYLNLSLADEHVGCVTIPIQVIEYNQNVLQAD
jgi:hypothetical protein